MVSSSSDFPQKSLQIKKDDKFFSRIVSKEGSMANPSFRIYYGGVSGAVPFMWESQPGTPKHTLFSNTTLPPLTPPPSYQFNSNKNPNKKHYSRSSTLLHTLFPRLKQSHNVSPSSSPSSLSLSSSWSSSTTSSMSVKKKRGRFSSSASRSSFDSMMDEYEEEPSFESSSHHTSTLCFGFGRETNNNTGGGGLRGGCSYSAMSMKKAFLSIVGQGSKLRY